MKSKFTMNYAENMWDHHLAQPLCSYELVGRFATVLGVAGPRKRAPCSATLPPHVFIELLGWGGAECTVQALSSCMEAGNSQQAAICRQA